MVIGENRKTENAAAKPNHENYFNIYYMEELKHEWICDRCGNTLKRDIQHVKTLHIKKVPEKVCEI